MDRRKKIIWILIGAAILVLAAAALLVWRHRGGGGEGTTIQSTKAHPLPKAVYYLQKDEEWAADPLGESRFTMGSSGCLVTSSVYPEATVTVYKTVDEQEIEAALDQQQYPLVRVKNLGDGYWHWVLLLGSGDDGYLCMDPLYSEKEARPLSAHGNTVYSWRLVTLPVKE